MLTGTRLCEDVELDIEPKICDVRPRAHHERLYVVSDSAYRIEQLVLHAVLVDNAHPRCFRLRTDMAKYVEYDAHGRSRDVADWKVDEDGGDGPSHELFGERVPIRRRAVS